MKDKTLISA